MAKNSPEEITTAHDWLDSASTTLGVSPEVTRQLVGDLLELTKDVAHGPSRPAAPITAFLVGLASGQGLSEGASDEEVTQLVREKVALINEQLKEYTD